MFDDKGRTVKEAGPSTPVEVLGLQGVPVFDRLRISPACPLILPSHVVLDRARERARGANAEGEIERAAIADLRRRRDQRRVVGEIGEHGHRRGDCNMSLDEEMNHPLHFRTFDIQSIVEIYSSGAIRWANSRLLPGEKLCVDCDAVLKTIDSHVGGFRESHGAQMPSNFQALTMRFVNGGFEFFRRQMYVRFERGHAFGGTFVDRATRFIRTGDRMHLRKSERVRFQIWRSQKHVRPGALARVDGALNREVGLRKHASGRA